MKINHLRFCACLFSLLFLCHFSFSQEKGPIIPVFSFEKGLGIRAPNDLFYLNFGIRIQSRISYTSANTDIFGFENVEARVRRMRLKFDGFVLNPKINYKLELGFENTSIDFEDASIPNVLLDAVVDYRPNNNWSILFGQTKLPGNRQRVISSGNLEMVDRTLTNARFNIDRDFGVQIHYTNHVNDFVFAIKGAITSGEGRNFLTTDEGLAYSGRIEFLPLGKFTNKGDYVEADLERETTPKVSFGFVAHTNQNAIRQRGETGRLLYEPRDLTSFMGDLMFKYEGWAFMAEYLTRSTDDPLTFNEEGDIRFVYAGHSMFIKGSYVFPKNWGLASSITWVSPSSEIAEYTDQIDEYAMGISKYIRGHKVKVQADIAYEDRHNKYFDQLLNDNWQVRFQMELGF
jgi:phosphate-selective porin OprO/OprP